MKTEEIILEAQVIKHYTAKLAKEKNINIGNDDSIAYNKSGEKTKASFLNYNDICFAPTQTLMQTVLRDHYYIIVLVYHNVEDDKYYHNVDGVRSNVKHDKYESALESGLQLAITQYR